MRLVINAVLFLSLGLMCNLKAQSILYSTSFGSGSLPSGWTSNNARWTAGTSNPSSGYTGASGSGNVVASNSSPSVSSLTLTYSNSLSTIGYTNIQVQWGARLTTNMRTIFLEYSIDGGASWTTPQSGSYGDGQNFTQVSANSTWALVGAATLDSETNGVSDLRLRFRFASNTTYGGTYSIDDFIITGTPLPAGVDYFNKSTGNANLENLSNWGTNSDGSGVSPTDFTSDNQRFIIVNGTSPTIGADWLVTGINSKVVVSTAGFTIPANFSYSGTIDVGNSSTLSIANTVIPNFGTIDPTSTVNYSAVGDQDITPFTYGNLEISGSGNKNIITDNLIVLGNLSINSGALSLFNNSLAYCELRGQISGSGTLIGGSNTTLSITGSGPFGNLKMDVSNNTINNLFINRPGQSINLTSALNVLNTLSLNSGTLNIGGNNLFLNITSVTGSGTLTSNSNGTVYYQRNGNQTIYNTNYGNIAFFGSGTKTFLSSSNIIGNLSIAGSTTINTNNFDINLGGDFLNSGSTFTPGTGTVTLNGSSDQAISGETTFNNLTINKPSGGNVNLSSGMQTIRGFLTIQTLSGANKLNTNGNLTLASDASSTASLIDNNSSASAGGSVNGNVTIQRYHNGGTAQTRIFGSPIASSNVFTIGQGTYNVLVYSEDGLSPYTRVSNTFNGSFRRATLGGTNLTVGRGYSIRKDAVGTLSYTGVPNNGTIPVSVTFSTALPTVSDRGWNMLSNPYPSAINWASVDKGTSGASNVSVSIWNGSTYTAASIIPSGIGFFTQATANGTITFNNSDRVGSGTTNNTIYRTESNSKLFYLNVSSTTGGAFDALAVTFDNNATVGFESNYDLIKPYVANGPFMFSRVDGNRLSLSVVPYPTTEIRIPVTLHVFNNGNYKFYPSSFADWYADYDVYLKDSTATGVQNINLRTTSNYTFSKNTNDTDTSSRFSLIFKYMPGVNTLAGTNTSTGNNTGSSGNTNSGVSFVLVNQNQVPWDELTIDGITNLASEEENLAKESLIFGHNSDIYIKFEADRSSSDVIVYDLIGNVIYQKENIPSVGIFKISLNYGNNSLYIVKVLNSKENTVKKLVLF